MKNLLTFLMLIISSQFGFCTNKLTADALIKATQLFLNSVGQNKFYCWFVFYLQKAFGLVDQLLLFYKIECLGMQRVAINWLKIYFFNKQQFMRITIEKIMVLPNKLSLPLIQYKLEYFRVLFWSLCCFLLSINDFPFIMR